MKVFLGLQFDKSWWANWDDADYLLALARKSTAFGRNIFKRYKNHPSFSGWYIPFEMSDTDFEDDEIEFQEAAE